MAGTSQGCSGGDEEQAAAKNKMGGDERIGRLVDLHVFEDICMCEHVCTVERSRFRVSLGGERWSGVFEHISDCLCTCDSRSV